MSKQTCVYILASKGNGTLYIGVTSNLVRRVWEHKQSLAQGSTMKYKIHDLVWYEINSTMESAFSREKALKNWKRKWKVQLIEAINPVWKDLYPSLL